MSYTKQQVFEALEHVIYLPTDKDLVSLNMIQDLKIDGSKISFSIIFKKSNDPQIDLIKQKCVQAIFDYVDKDADIKGNITAKAIETVDDNDKVLSNVKNIIAVCSGKGGVGKSTVAANLAVALSKTGAKVGLIDADIHGPSIHIMFDVVDSNPSVIEKDGKQMIEPIKKYGISLLSIGFFVNTDKALIWRGPMISKALSQLLSDGNWGELDYLIVDLPPGTGDIQITLAQKVDITGIIVVSTPQNVALADARKAVNMFSQASIKVPVLGLIENMAYFTPTELPDNKYYIFGKQGCKKLAEELNVPFLGQIPLTESVCESGDKGKPVALDNDTFISKAFNDVAKNAIEQLKIINAN